MADSASLFFFDFHLFWNIDKIMMNLPYEKQIGDDSIRALKGDSDKITIAYGFINKQVYPYYAKRFRSRNKIITFIPDTLKKADVMAQFTSHLHSTHTKFEEVIYPK